MPNTDRHLSLLLVLFLLAGCTLPLANHAAAPAELLDSATQCTAAERQPRALLIDDRQQLQRIAGRLRDSILPERSPRLPAVDFSRWRVLYLSAGERSTAGYRLTLDRSAFTVREGRGVLRVRLETPPPDAAKAAVITHPCLLVKLPLDDYTAIEIRGLGKRLEVPVKKRLPQRKIR